MSFLENGLEMVLGMLKNKATLKKKLCSQTHVNFARFKSILQEIEKEYSAELGKLKDPPRFMVSDLGEFEAQLSFGGDTLFFTMHSNVFGFEPTHPIHQTAYVREDPSRAYCGMIQIHNFLNSNKVVKSLLILWSCFLKNLFFLHLENRLILYKIKSLKSTIV